MLWLAWITLVLVLVFMTLIQKLLYLLHFLIISVNYSRHNRSGWILRYCHWWCVHRSRTMQWVMLLRCFMFSLKTEQKIDFFSVVVSLLRLRLTTSGQLRCNSPLRSYREGSAELASNFSITNHSWIEH